jgi:hypothetical protein
MNKIIKELLHEWKQRKLPSLIERRYDLQPYVEGKLNKVIAVSGFRRVGKTFLLYDLSNKLLKRYKKEEVIYINFEDERIQPDISLLTNLIPVIKETFGVEPKYLLLDEIQVIPNWSKWVRRINESTDIRIVITGSNSKMSSFEIPTELRGRFIELHVFPLDFTEYLRFKGLHFDKESIENDINLKSIIINYYNEYLIWGGLPEPAICEEFKKKELLQSYFRTVIDRDISEHYKVNNDTLLKYTLLQLINSRTITISKLTNTLKSSQIHASKTTVGKYLDYIEGSYFIDFIKCFSYKIKDQMMHPRKAYCIDNGFITALSNTGSSNAGYLFENAVARTLISENEELFYWKDIANNYEVDFVIRNSKGKTHKLIQASLDISDAATFNREIRALLFASRELHCKELIILTQTEEKTISPEWYDMKEKIKIIPFWKYLLEL